MLFLLLWRCLRMTCRGLEGRDEETMSAEKTADDTRVGCSNCQRTVSSLLLLLSLFRPVASVILLTQAVLFLLLVL